MAWTKAQKEHYERYFNAMRRNIPVERVSDERLYRIMDLLHRNETTLNRLNDLIANVEMSERQTKQVEKQDAQAEARVRKLAAEMGLEVIIEGDPRGDAIRIVTPDKTSNSWDGETWVIKW